MNALGCFVYFALVFTVHTIQYFYIIYNFEFDFKRRLMSLFFISFSSSYRSPSLNSSSIVSCVSSFTLKNFVVRDNLINYMLDYRFFLFMSSETFLGCSLLHVVFSRPAFRILKNKVTQDLKFIWWMFRAMDETS